MSIYATDWEYTPEPRRYGEGTHHLVSGLTADGRRIDLVEIHLDYDDDFDALMSDADAAKIARLIAAAPDLLAALKAAREELEAYEERATGETYNNSALNAAISKAEAAE